MQLSAALLLAFQVILTAGIRWITPRLANGRRAYKTRHRGRNLTGASGCVFDYSDRRGHWRGEKPRVRVTIHARMRSGRCSECGAKARNGRRWRLPRGLLRCT